MPTPLPDAERRRLVEGLMQRGASRDEILDALSHAEGYGPISGLTVPPSTSAPVTLQEQEEGRQFYTETLPRAVVAGGASLAAAPLTAGMSIPLGALTEAGIVGGGDIAYQGVRKLIDPTRTIDPMESIDIGLTAGGTTAATRGVMDFLARQAKIAPKLVRYFRKPATLKPKQIRIGQYGRTFGELPAEAEHEFGERLKQAVEEWRSAKTKPRIAKEAILQNATGAGVKIDARPVVQALEEVKLATPKTATGNKLNAELTQMQRSFKRVSTPANPYAGQQPGGPIQGTKTKLAVRTDLTPKELDEFLTREIDNRIYKLSGSPKNQALAEALANARGEIRATLLKSLPKEASEATAQIYEELTKREVATKAISPTLVSLETKVRNLFKPGHQAEINALKTISEQTGHDYVAEAFRIAQKRAFSPDDRIVAAGIWRALARSGLKAFAPIQATAGPIAAGVRAGVQEKRNP